MHKLEYNNFVALQVFLENTQEMYVTKSLSGFNRLPPFPPLLNQFVATL